MTRKRERIIHSPVSNGDIRLLQNVPEVPTPGISAEAQAQQLLQAKKLERVESCKREIEIVLAKYNCIMDVSMVLRENNISAQITVLPKTET